MTLVYNAWNQLVAYKNGGTTLETMSYDGLGREVIQNAGTATDLYYSNQWQVLEEQVGGAAKINYVWSPVYVDAMVLRDRDATGGGTLSERLWVQQDANWNVTALVNTIGKRRGALRLRPVRDDDGAERVVGDAERQRVCVDLRTPGRAAGYDDGVVRVPESRFVAGAGAMGGG